MFVIEASGVKNCEKIYLDEESATVGMTERFSEFQIEAGEVKIVKVAAISYFRDKKSATVKA